MNKIKTWLKQNLLKYILYLGRWQLSTPILAWCCFYFAALGETWAATISNLIGGIIFFWVDRLIFKQTISKKVILIDRKELMENWDVWADYYRSGGKGSWPRDAFESWIDEIELNPICINELLGSRDILKLYFKKAKAEVVIK